MNTLLSYFLLAAIAITALLALSSTKASRNSFLLILELGLIMLYLFASNRLTIFSSSIMALLILFCLIMLTINIYLEKSVQLTTNISSKSNILIGITILVWFGLNLPNFNLKKIPKISYSLFTDDAGALCMAIFITLSMLISSFLIIDTRNS